MNKKYVIQWKSNVNGRAGKGTKLFEQEEGQRLVEELNFEHPEIEHELVERRPDPVVHNPAAAEPEEVSGPESEEGIPTEDRHPAPVP